MLPNLGHSGTDLHRSRLNLMSAHAHIHKHTHTHTYTHTHTHNTHTWQEYSPINGREGDSENVGNLQFWYHFTVVLPPGPTRWEPATKAPQEGAQWMQMDSFCFPPFRDFYGGNTPTRQILDFWTYIVSIPFDNLR